MSEPATSESPVRKSAVRPRTVAVASWLWALAAVLLILLGLISLTTPSSGLREQLAGYADLDSAVMAVRASGVVSLLVGLGVGLTVSAVREGASRARGIAVGLSVAYSVVQMLLIVVGLNTVFALTVPLLLLVASVLVFRSEGHVWFVR